MLTEEKEAEDLDKIILKMIRGNGTFDENDFREMDGEEWGSSYINGLISRLLENAPTIIKQGPIIKGPRQIEICGYAAIFYDKGGFRKILQDKKEEKNNRDTEMKKMLDEWELSKKHLADYQLNQYILWATAVASLGALIISIIALRNGK